MLQDAFRLTTLRKVSSILDCQPSPTALKVDHLGAQPQRHQLLCRRLVRAAPLSDRSGEIGEGFCERLGAGEIRFRQFGIVADVTQILLAIASLFLAFGILFPFVLAGGSHADDAHAFAAEPGEYDDHNAAYADADRDPTPALVVRRNDQRVVKKRFIQISEIQPVLVEVGADASVRPKQFP